MEWKYDPQYEWKGWGRTMKEKDEREGWRRRKKNKDEGEGWRRNMKEKHEGEGGRRRTREKDEGEEWSTNRGYHEEEGWMMAAMKEDDKWEGCSGHWPLECLS